MTRRHLSSVLVTDGDTRSAVAIARSLGRRGIPVWIASAKRNALGAWSRYARGRVMHPPAEQDPEGFAAAIMAATRAGRGDLVFATTDIALAVLSQVRSAGDQAPLRCLPPPDAVNLTLNKAALLELARAHAVPAPTTYSVEQPGGIDALASGLSYPVVVKTRRSRILRNGRWTAGAVVYADSPQTLRSAYEKVRALDDEPLIQEYIPGRGCGVFVLARDGETRALFAHQRLRENPPQGGVSVMSESCAPHPVAEQSARALMRALRWHGVAMIEFRLDARDDTPKLMEINGRFWGSLALAVSAGVDFPYLLYRLAEDGDVAGPADYAVGVRNRWLIGDFDRLLTAMRGPRTDGAAPPGRWSEIRSFLGAGRRTRYEMEHLDDPLPALAEAGLYAWRMLRLVGGRCWRPRG